MGGGGNCPLCFLLPVCADLVQPPPLPFKNDENNVKMYSIVASYSCHIVPSNDAVLNESLPSSSLFLLCFLYSAKLLMLTLAMSSS